MSVDGERPMKGSTRYASKGRLAPRRQGSRRRRLLKAGVWVGAALLLAACAAAWLTVKVMTVRDELDATTRLVEPLKESLANEQTSDAKATVDAMRAHTSSARSAADDPLWSLAAALPVLGANLSAVGEVARTADDVVSLGLTPLVNVVSSLNLDNLIPGRDGADLDSLRRASPSVVSAAHAVRASSERLERIDASTLMPKIAEPLLKARGELGVVTGTLDTLADAAHLLPNMLGEGGKRTYLLMIQNNAESRASGGIPGALAILTLDNGKLTLGQHSSANELGVMTPALSLDAEQTQIYSGRLGKYMQDVNLTPDFPTAASTAQAMWEKKTGQHVDGVVSIDPVTLGYVLDATGPVKLSSPELAAVAKGGLPTELNGKNVVSTLLSDVYLKIEQPKLQDAYFAGVAQEVFAALSTGKGDPKGLIEGLTRGTAESRVLLWSSRQEEQKAISEYPLSGAIDGPSVAPAQFGVYFNDGTGAKMDYYVKRTVQLVEECTGDEYGQIKVRVTSTNTAPADAATSLPAYVTGDGAFGVSPGTVQTNIIVYGPVQASVKTALVDGKQADFAAHRHSNRPVGTVTNTLEPGQSSTVEITFGKIVQHTEPNLAVTPTVQPVKDVNLAVERADCIPSK